MVYTDRSWTFKIRFFKYPDNFTTWLTKIKCKNIASREYFVEQPSHCRRMLHYTKRLHYKSRISKFNT